jgi:O-antigen/teichoic acid export membrane protein
MKERITHWQNDPLLKQVVRGSAHLFSSTGVSALLGFVQGILAARLLGAAEWGLAATITVFASNINRLLSFRMSEIVVQRMSDLTTESKRADASASIQLAGLIEAAVALIAYLIVILLSGWGARVFGKDESLAGLFSFYGIILISNIVHETATGILQAARRFDWIARVNIIQSIVTFAGIALAFIFNLTIFAVLSAYVIGKTINEIALIIGAMRAAHDQLGDGWMRVPIASAPDKRGMFAFAISTNLNGTVNLFVRDNILLYVNALTSTTEAGYFKIAQSLINLILLPLEPFIWPTYTEITQSVAKKAYNDTRRLLRRVSLIALAWAALAGGTLAATGWFLIPLAYGLEFAPSYSALLILLIGYGFASVFQWNRPLWLALHRASYPTIVAALAGGIEVALIFWLTPIYGYLIAAAIFSAFLIASVGIIAWRGYNLLSE